MDREIIRTKQELCWHAALTFLMSFNFTAIMRDEGFAAIYQQMYDYVTSKIKLKNKSDILDVYVVVEQ